MCKYNPITSSLMENLIIMIKYILFVVQKICFYEDIHCRSASLIKT